MPDEDQKLFRRLRAGDREAYAEVAVKYHREIWAYLYRLTNDYEMAEDLAQEVAVKFWQSAPQFGKISSLKAWIYRVAYNLFVTHNRGRRLELVELDENIPEISNSDDPEKMLDRRLLEEELISALNRLPENHRRAVILTKVQGLKMREAAEVMEIPLGTVQWLVHQGLKHLRVILQKEEADRVCKQA